MQAIESKLNFYYKLELNTVNKTFDRVIINGI